MRASFKPGLWSTIGMLLGLAVLLSLGTWQFLRFEEKSRWESLRDTRLAADPSATSVSELSAPGNDYRIVTVKGRFLAEHLFLFNFRVRDSVPGYWLGQLFEGEDGARVLVNRGWIPSDGGLAIAEELRSDDEVELTALVFTPEQIIPDETTRSEVSRAESLPATTAWNTYDIQAVYDATGVERTRPTVLIASPESSGSPYPIASYDYVISPYLTSEKHLGYSLTWYILAGALILMWIAYGFGYLGSYARRAGGKSATNA